MFIRRKISFFSVNQTLLYRVSVIWICSSMHVSTKPPSLSLTLIIVRATVCEKEGNAVQKEKGKREECRWVYVPANSTQ